jgi:hypothetical protein
LPRDVLEISRQIDRWSVFNLPLLIALTLPGGEARQQPWIEQVVPVLLGKPTVQAIFWDRLFDLESGSFSDRGLLDRDGQPKSAWHAFSKIRPWVE